MAVMYFAKININRDIYEVYGEQRDYQKELYRIYEAINEEVSVDVEGPESFGAMYTFASVNKDPDKLYITGRLIRVEPGANTTFDRTKHDVIDTFDENKASYITFFVDISTEIIGFVAKRDFGFRMFLSAFSRLLSRAANTEYEVYLISDKREFKSKVSGFRTIQSMTITAVPPNNDKELFDDLFGISRADAKAIGLGKLKESLHPRDKDGLHVTDQLWQKVDYSITGGGTTSVRGISIDSDEPVTISSDEDAPYKKAIQDDDKDNQEAIRFHGEQEVGKIIAMREWQARKE